ncbi:uncharacterized protein LOC127125992 [Lathyrus oleraceus]|uniref:uncharacterized protein LOC127125992 n=1 Tax=Pisum sativum TaxID=3888 RepID=UPI0021D05B7C|nr:uncharacterized protein LOC127125992 [Pisum sativum]
MGRSGKRKRTSLEKDQKRAFDKKLDRDYDALMETEKRRTRELRQELGYEEKFGKESESSSDQSFIMEKTQDREETMEKVRVLEKQIEELSSIPNSDTKKNRKKIQRIKKRIDGYMKHHHDLGKAIEKKQRKGR